LEAAVATAREKLKLRGFPMKMDVTAVEEAASVKARVHCI
jgi:hypothetical protein